MSGNSPNKILAAEAAVRLGQAHTAYQSPPDLNPGDMVRLAQFSTTADVTAAGAHSIGAVLEVVPSLRKFTGQQASCAGPGILLAFICHDGTISAQWVGAWLYEIAPPEHIRGGAPLHG